MQCENCGKIHDGSYGSGRFCSSKCSRGFSTKSKRSEINESVSKKLKGTFNGKPAYENIKKICAECGKEFEIDHKHRSQIYCSHACTHSSSTFRENVSKGMKGINVGEKNGMYGKSPANVKRIEVQSDKHVGNTKFFVRSSWESKYVDELNSDSNVVKFEFEPRQYRVKYVDEFGAKRTYQPDFLINDTIVVEIKNSWNVKLKETQLKETAFKIMFPFIEYRLIFW